MPPLLFDDEDDNDVLDVAESVLPASTAAVGLFSPSAAAGSFEEEEDPVAALLLPLPILFWTSGQSQRSVDKSWTVAAVTIAFTTMATRDPGRSPTMRREPLE